MIVKRQTTVESNAEYSHTVRHGQVDASNIVFTQLKLQCFIKLALSAINRSKHSSIFSVLYDIKTPQFYSKHFAWGVDQTSDIHPAPQNAH